MDLVCFCHLRWNFVYQRPQHLLSRFARAGRVFVIEEPVFDSAEPFLESITSKESVHLLIPHLPGDKTETDSISAQQNLLKDFFTVHSLGDYVAWYYTPMALPLGEALPPPSVVVYDCMDELSAFKFAPPELKSREEALMKKADLVFTGGYRLWEAKKDLHSNAWPFPSSIDKAHFGSARKISVEPEDQAGIPGPKIGFFGVVDERFDIELLREAARAKPQWQFVILGPVVKIDQAVLPKSGNIHYLGGKSYDDLPAYLSGWDVALIPFALNESTEFISPTKTPEYLAGGVPVVSTAIRDVVRPYGEEGLVAIATNAQEFIEGIETGLQLKSNSKWLERVDEFLADNSWDNTWSKMNALVKQQIIDKQNNKTTEEKIYV